MQKTITRAYRVRMYPTQNIAGMFLRWCDVSADLYNWGLAIREAEFIKYKEHIQKKYNPAGCQHIECVLPAFKALNIKPDKQDTKIKREHSLSGYDMSNIYTRKKKELLLSKFDELPDWVGRCTLVDLDNAYKKFFDKKQKAGYPKKKVWKKYDNSIRIRNHNDIKIIDNKLKIPKQTELIRLSNTDRKPNNQDIKEATIRQDTLGRWYVIFIVVEEYKPLPKTKGIIGLDKAIGKDALVGSNGKRVELDLPRISKEYKKQEFLSRQLSKKKRGSKAWVLTKKKLNKLYSNSTRTRTNHYHHATTDIVKNNQTIKLEHLPLYFMIQNKQTARKTAKVALGEIHQFLKYKAEWNDRTFIEVEAKDTSKMCSKCEFVNKKITIKDKHWECENCGYLVADRDINAGKNILKKKARVKKEKVRA